MSFFSSLFHKKKAETKSGSNNKEPNFISLVDSNSLLVQKGDSEWEELSEFVEASPEEYELVSVIAASIAANDHPESEFVMKRILQRNPEVLKVSLIAASITAGDSLTGNLVVKSIAKRKNK